MDKYCGKIIVLESKGKYRFIDMDKRMCKCLFGCILIATDLVLSAIIIIISVCLI